MTDSASLSQALTLKQQAFIDAYLANGFNATQAAITAKYSRKTARSIGYENLTKPHIKAVIDAYLSTYAMSAKEVLARLTAHAQGDIGDVWNEKKGGVDWGRARRLGATSLIKRVKRKTRRETTMINDELVTVDIIEEEIEFHDAQAALIQLGKVHGLFIEKTEHLGDIGLSWKDVIKAAQDHDAERDSDTPRAKGDWSDRE